MIKIIEQNDLQKALELVNKVFSEFVAVEYSEKGQKTFRDYLEHKYDETAADLISGHKKMWGYYFDNEIAGVISTRDVSHISLLFVDKKYHRKGIAKALFSEVLTELEQNPDVKKITVNSSPYAVEVYKKLGFNQTGEKQERDGIIFVPMEYII